MAGTQQETYDYGWPLIDGDHSLRELVDELLTMPGFKYPPKWLPIKVEEPRLHADVEPARVVHEIGSEHQSAYFEAMSHRIDGDTMTVTGRIQLNHGGFSSSRVPATIVFESIYYYEPTGRLETSFPL